MKILFFLLITLFFATIGFAEVSHQSDDTNKKIEKIEEKLDSTKEELTKYTQITEDTKERVGDINSSVDRFGILVSFFGILITGIVIFFSFRSTNEAKLEAKIVAQKEAQDEAKKLLQEWIDKEAKSVFEAKVNALSDELQVKGNEILKQIEEKADAQHQRHEEDHKNWMVNLNSTQEEKDEVEKEAKQIEGKKEEDLTFNDYWVRIVNQFNRKTYDDVLVLIDKAMKFISDGSDNVEKHALLLLAKGITYAQNENVDEAIKIYDELISKYINIQIDDIVKYVVNAMFNKAVMLHEQGKSEISLEVYDLLISTYKNSNIDEVVKFVAKSMYNKGIVLDKLKKTEEALIVYEEMISMYKQSKDESVAEQTARTMLNKGAFLNKLNKDEEAIIIYDEVISHYKSFQNTSILEHIASAMYNKGLSLSKLKKPDEELKMYDEIIGRFKNSDSERIMVQRVRSMLNKGVILSEQKNKECIEIYNQLISEYKDSENLIVMENVASAMFNIGGILGQINQYEEAILSYEKIISAYQHRKEEGMIKQIISALQNKFELEIILDKPIFTDRTLIEKLTQSPKVIAVIDMLLILQNAKISLQEIEIKLWLEKYKDVKHSGWNFDELEKWIANATYSDEIKERISGYIKTFKTQLHRT